MSSFKLMSITRTEIQIEALSNTTYTEIAALLYGQSGLDLRTGKKELVSSRLAKLLKQKKCPSFEHYLKILKADGTGESLAAMIDALTTNHTAFLRERQHFDFLAERAPHLFASRKKLEVWSAASATGEEVYTLLMVLIEALKLPFPSAQTESWLRVLGTDISTTALENAKAGIYPEEKLGPLPIEWKKKYFLKGKGIAEGKVRIKPELCKMAKFSQVNLIKELFSVKLYPVIFCRNVMIYFDKATQRQVVKSLVKCLEPEGFFMTGHAESIAGLHSGLTYVAPALYQNRGRSIPINPRTGAH